MLCWPLQCVALTHLCMSHALPRYRKPAGMNAARKLRITRRNQRWAQKVRARVACCVRCRRASTRCVVAAAGVRVFAVLHAGRKW